MGAEREKGSNKESSYSLVRTSLSLCTPYCKVGFYVMSDEGNGRKLGSSYREREREGGKQPIRTRYLGHVTGYQPIRDQYFRDNLICLDLKQIDYYN
eukprot:sb/3479089/